MRSERDIPLLFAEEGWRDSLIEAGASRPPLRGGEL